MWDLNTNTYGLQPCRTIWNIYIYIYKCIDIYVLENKTKLPAQETEINTNKIERMLDKSRN